MRRGNYPAPSRFGLLVILGLFVVAGCGKDKPAAIPMDIPFRPDGILEFLATDSSVITRIAIEIADTDSAQIRGLMDRRSLPERGGMLFVYTDEAQRSFWMRSTPLPLDLLFITGADSVLNIVEHTVPYSDDRIESTGPAGHVLEVRAGFTERWGIISGTRIRWSRVDSAPSP